MDIGALVVQTLPVNLLVILTCPHTDIIKLPQSDAAAHEVLVGVQDQVQQVFVGRHGKKAVDFNGGDIGKEVVQLVMGILRGIK